jgi:hypothetical protein
MALPALPAAVLVGCALRLAWHVQGSIAATDWLGYAVLTALLLALPLAAGAAALPSRSVTAAIGALALLGVWALVSLEWSPLPTLARDEGLLTLWYVLVVAVAAVGARTAEARLWTIATAGLGLAGLALATAATLRFGGSPLSRYDGGRLSFPITYANAQASMFAIGFWPCIVIASRRSSHLLLRAAGVGAAAACLGGVLLPQSKGAILGLAVATIAVAAVSPDRLRLLVPAGIAFLGGAAAFRPLTGPFRVYTPAAEAAAIQRAGLALLVLAAGGAAAGLLYALADRRITLDERWRRLAGRLALVCLLLAVAAGGIAAAAAIGNPGEFAQRKWSTFTRMPNEERTSTHLLTLGSNRYDFWRVAAGEFSRHPLAGTGARGFGAAYLVHGRSPETPARAHSVAMDVLSEQGIVGFALLAIGLGLLIVAAGRGARVRNAPAVAGFAAGVAWLAQALVDWTWTFPAVTVPALVLLAAACGRDGPTLRRPVALGAAGVAVLAALLLFAPPWVAGRIALDALRTRDASGLDRARRLDPVSVQPLLAQFQLAPTPLAGLPPLELAARKEPRSVGIRYTLGLVELELARPRAATVDLRAALALKPGDSAILAALRRARAG